MIQETPTPDASSLDRLQDIVEASPVSWWPPAPGWWVVGAVVLLAGCIAGIRAWQRWQAQAYRRAALQELDTATTVAAVAGILKRTALAAWPRANVASLSGAAWCDWLRQTAAAELTQEVADTLSRGIYRHDQSASAALLAYAGRWIRDHQVSPEPVVREAG